MHACAVLSAVCMLVPFYLHACLLNASYCSDGFLYIFYHDRFPDEEAGQIPMAFIVRKPGSSLGEQQVVDFVAKQVFVIPSKLSHHVITEKYKFKLILLWVKVSLIKLEKLKIMLYSYRTKLMFHPFSSEKLLSLENYILPLNEMPAS